MWVPIQKLTYRAKAHIPRADAELEERLRDRRELPLCGIHGERLYMTGVTKLEWRAAQLQTMYEQLPESNDATECILLDAWASAIIEGARVSLPQVKQHLSNLQTKDERMLVNTILGSNYAYNRPITQKNLRTLWEQVTDGVCENARLDGKPYRSGMVEIGSASRTVHAALSEAYSRLKPEDLPQFHVNYVTIMFEKTVGGDEAFQDITLTIDGKDYPLSIGEIRLHEEAVLNYPGDQWLDGGISNQTLIADSHTMLYNDGIDQICPAFDFTAAYDMELLDLYLLYPKIDILDVRLVIDSQKGSSMGSFRSLFPADPP